MAGRKTRVLTVSVPPEAAEDFDRIAARRDATAASCSGRCSPSTGRTSRAQTFESLQRYGEARASRRAVETDKDVERLIRTFWQSEEHLRGSEEPVGRLRELAMIKVGGTVESVERYEVVARI